MSGQTKRTRSQKTLLDLPHISYQQSPLKVATKAARSLESGSGVSQLKVAGQSGSRLNQHNAGSDDELLLSPRKLAPKKRSSSPTDGGSSFADGTETRESKRVRRNSLTASPHQDDRHSPPPDQVLYKGPFDFSSLKSKKSVSSNHRSPGKLSTKRAQSVPPVSPSVPHIDLRTIPPSPWRAGSVSPVRQQLRFISLPRLFENGGEPDDMDVDQPGSPLHDLASRAPKSSQESSNYTNSEPSPPSSLTNASLMPSSETDGLESTAPQAPALQALRTPAQHLRPDQGLGFFPLSPLTPLPATPFLPRKLPPLSNSGRVALFGLELPSDHAQQSPPQIQAQENFYVSATPRAALKSPENTPFPGSSNLDDVITGTLATPRPTAQAVPSDTNTESTIAINAPSSTQGPPSKSSVSTPAASSQSKSSVIISRLPRPSSSLSLTHKSEKSDASSSTLPNSGHEQGAPTKVVAPRSELAPKIKAKKVPKAMPPPPPPRMTRATTKRQKDAEAKANVTHVAGKYFFLLRQGRRITNQETYVPSKATVAHEITHEVSSPTLSADVGDIESTGRVELSPFLASSASIEQNRQVESTTRNELDIDRAVSGVPACWFRLRTECGSAIFPNGIFTCLICCSTYLLFRKGLRSRANVVLLIATLIMFGVSSSQWGTQFATVVKQIQGVLIREPDQTLESKYPTVNETTLKLSFVDQYLSSINFLVGDSIIIWRVWVLYDGKRKIMIVPIIPLIIATVTTFLVGGLQSRVLSTNVEDPNDIYNILAFWFQVATYGLELATNLAATSLIAYKAWKHRKLIKSALGPRRKTKVEKVLALLVESGVLYCILWILLIGFEFVPPASFANYFAPTAVHIAGMYPTVIVILVSIDQTVWEMTGILVADSLHHERNLGMLDFAHPRFSLPIEVSRQERSSGSVLQLGSVQVQSAGRDVQLTTVNEDLKAASFIV
ncbi:hypothetical protein EW146_g10030 [Bondarzewia mesenterica]|uniref:Uncharacterized protein n=1 Tax=Bondarzewia mesenterica TaxID=1095465 RepID=A0A4S4L122_9AGAM|nr:hypothetical protein EW146_g10030 [Bondarzewia mesenterica]